MPLEVAGVQRPPASVVGLDLGRDDGVSVQLGVIGARRGLAERGPHQPGGVGVLTSAVHTDKGRRAVPLQVRERDGDRLIVHGEDAVVTGECPQDTDRLRSRKRRIEPGHGLHDRAIGADTIYERRAQRCPRCWVTALEQRLQRIGRHDTVDAEAISLRARPHARRLTDGLAEVLRVVRR